VKALRYCSTIVEVPHLRQALELIERQVQELEAGGTAQLSRHLWQVFVCLRACVRVSGWVGAQGEAGVMMPW